LIGSYFKKEIDSVKKNGIKINIIGKTKILSPNVKKILKTSVQKTKLNKKIIVNLALNYGSRDEIINAINKIKNKDKITENILSKNLYTTNLPDPDILIRTGGKKRLSNFLLWQLAYTELYFIDKLWPDFNNIDFRRIIKQYQKVKRNFGKI
jgi:undecaprenyl diphosphate synthase